MYVPSNGAIMNVVYRDSDLVFSRSQNMKYPENSESKRKKCPLMTFIEVDRCHRMTSLRMLYREILVRAAGVQCQYKDFFS